MEYTKEKLKKEGWKFIITYSGTMEQWDKDKVSMYIEKDTRRLAMRYDRGEKLDISVKE